MKTPPCPANNAGWIARRQEVRATEWALHLELVAAARAALANFQENAHKVSVADIARLVDLSSRLARLACGMEPGQLESGPPAVRIEIAAALKRVFSQPIDILAEQVKTPALPPLDDSNPPPQPAQP